MIIGIKNNSTTIGTDWIFQTVTRYNLDEVRIFLDNHQSTYTFFELATCWRNT